MIKFFRRIRQKLISKNKFSRYLIYAFGEIVLVVLGILIALSIDNWNEHRKATREEVKILEKLNSDLKANLTEIKGINSLTKLRVKSCQTILNYFQENKPVDDSLRLCFEYINNDDLFNNANTTYKFIENQGLNVLSNDSLQSKITWIYERDFKNITIRENRNMQMVIRDLRPLMDINFETSEIQLAFYDEKYSINNPLNIEELKESTRFKNVVIRIQNYLQLRLYWQNDTMDNLERLIRDIDSSISH